MGICKVLGLYDGYCVLVDVFHFSNQKSTYLVKCADWRDRGSNIPKPKGCCGRVL